MEVSFVTLNHAQQLKGSVNFNNVLRWRTKGEELIARASSAITFDMSAVCEHDSSLVALLLAWRRYAKVSGKNLIYINPPESLLRVAQVCNVTPLLGINGNG